MFLNNTLKESINGGRLHHQLTPMLVEAEGKVPVNVRNYLEKVGHNVEIFVSSGFAAVTAIGMRNGFPEPIYDRRRIGSTATVLAS